MRDGGPIGVFDSGVGGLTVWRHLRREVGQSAIFYFGDTGHVPYGSRSREELIGLADQIVGFLIKEGAALIVDACNSTSSVALDFLQAKYDPPIVGVVEPGAKVAGQVTRNGKIGVIATEATIQSQSHRRLLQKINPGLEIFGQACPPFVPLVEAGDVGSDRTRRIVQAYLEPLQHAGIDTLVLGCTHYPFLAPVLSEVMGPEVVLVDPAWETVQEVLRIRGGADAGADASMAPNKATNNRFFVSGPAVEFERTARALLPEMASLITGVQQVGLDCKIAAGS